MKQITNNRIESIKQFLEDFRNRDPEHWFTQFIIDSGFLDYYKNQFMQEYIKQVIYYTDIKIGLVVKYLQL